MVLNGLRQLTDCYRLWGRYEKALEYAWRQAALAPWNEEVHQQVMRLLALTGQRTAALSQYDACRRYLKNELGVEPGLETIRLYEQIRDGKLEEFTVPPALVVGQERDVQMPGFLNEAVEEIQPPAVVAREHELASLDRYLKEMLAGHGPVVFVSEEAGCLLHATKANARQTGERFLSWRIHASLGRVYWRMCCCEEAEREFSAARVLVEELAGNISDKGLKEKFLDGTKWEIRRG